MMMKRVISTISFANKQGMVGGVPTPRDALSCVNVTPRKLWTNGQTVLS